MFNSIITEPLPEKALLARYKPEDSSQGYTDCFAVALNQNIELSDYIEAFYTSPVFKLERTILRLVGKSSTNAQAKELAQGNRASFAAWRVEDRTPEQILLCDFMGKTRSWLMTETDPTTQQATLYFGSAVVFPAQTSNQRSNSVKKPLGFSLMSRLHVIYSKVLLNAAYRKLIKP